MNCGTEALNLSLTRLPGYISITSSITSNCLNAIKELLVVNGFICHFAFWQVYCIFSSLTHQLVYIHTDTFDALTLHCNHP